MQQLAWYCIDFSFSNLAFVISHEKGIIQFCEIFYSVCPFCIIFILLVLFRLKCQSINRVLLIKNVLQSSVYSKQHGLGKSEEEGEIWVWRRHQQEDEHAATSARTLSPKRVSSSQAGRGHLQDKHGKEAQGASQRKQEQPGQYIYNL